jgi:hypothetical protein
MDRFRGVELGEGPLRTVGGGEADGAQGAGGEVRVAHDVQEALVVNLVVVVA